MSKQRTLVVQFVSEPDSRVMIPADGTVTFGGLIPGAKTDGGCNRTALRVYVGKRQIAVFTSVKGFRFIDDVSVLEKRVQQAAKTVVVEEDGVQRSKNVTVTSEDWVNPDEIKPSADNQAVRSQLLKETNTL